MLFGAQIEGSLNIDLAIIYADFKAIAGFDIALFHDKDFMCEGKSAGYNGWYGIGQIYGYFKGDVGVKIDVWFFEGKASLGSIEAGALLMGGMPNPMWAFGKVRIRGSVLGGLIKISTSVSMEIGTPCYPDESSNPLDNIRILETTNPGYETIADARDNPPESIFLDPRITANVPLSGAVEHLVKIELPPTSKNKHGSFRNYKFFIKDVTIYQGNATTVPSNAPAIPNTFTYDNNEAYVANISVEPGLKPLTYYKIVVRATGMVFENGDWVNPLIQGERKEHIETLETFFRTGPAPNYIPKENLVFSMPLNRQRNFYTREYLECGILLKIAQDNLFNNPDKRVELWVRSLDNQYAKKLSFYVSVDGKGIYYQMPTDMPKNQLYNLALIRIDLEGEQNFLNALALENRRKLLTSLSDNSKMELLESVIIKKELSTLEKLNQAGQEGTLIMTQQAGMAGGGNLMVTTPTLSSAVANATSQGASSGSTTQQVTSTKPGQQQIAQISSKTTSATTLVAGGGLPKVAGGSTAGTGMSFDEQAMQNWVQIQQGYIGTYKNDTSDHRKIESMNKAEFGFIDTLVNIYFRTSFFDKVSDKIAAAGVVKATAANDFKTNPNCLLELQSANIIEGFEDMEWKSYSSTVTSSENKYGSQIPPLLIPFEYYDPSLNDHAVWNTKVFEMLHWVYDECERANFKIKNTTVQAPEVIDLSFLYRRTDPARLKTPDKRDPSDFYPLNRVGSGSFNPLWPLFTGVIVPGITNAEIRQKRPDTYNSRIKYSAYYIRKTLHVDYLSAHAFVLAYSEIADHWSEGDADDRNRKARDCVKDNWGHNIYLLIPESNLNNWITFPYYQMVQFWEDKMPVHQKLSGLYNNLPTNYINILMPPLNYDGRQVQIQRIHVGHPTQANSTSPLKWQYSHSCFMNISYNP
jgi:hypothetical protein